MGKAKCAAYVVFKGRKPGVYLTWDECEAQVKGFPSNSQQGFGSLKEAEARWQEHRDQMEMGIPQRSMAPQPRKRAAAHIDLTGSDCDLSPAAKRVQYGAPGSSTMGSSPLGASSKNAARHSSDGFGAYRLYVATTQSKVGPYVPPKPTGAPPVENMKRPSLSFLSPRLKNYTPSDIIHNSSFDQVEEPAAVEEDPNIVLTAEQEKVVSLVLAGKNLFLTGAGGSGKTVTLKTILARLRKRKVPYQVVAPTGIAALPLNGKTIFSFFGWKPDTLQRSIEDITNDRKPWIEKNVAKIRVLVIEEISMVENQFLERMNLMMQAIKNNDQPFGGIQIIALGDFHQLPPVKPFEYCLQCGSRMARAKKDNFDVSCNKCDISFPDGEKWAFTAPVWQELGLRHVQLQQIHRQKDKLFQDILFKIRNGIMLSTEEWGVLESKKQLPPGICAVRLMSMRRDVDALNKRELDRINSPPRSWDSLDTYESRFDGPQRDSKPWIAERPLDNHRFASQVVLKIGAKVVLLTNLDPEGGLVNGSQGEVIGFEPDDQEFENGASMAYVREEVDDKDKAKKKRRKGEKEWVVKTRAAPIVRFANGTTRPISAIAVTSRTGKQPLYQYNATRAQVPLALAWALTIHKSQGMTLNYIEVLSRDIFERGQFYVALSRGTSLAGLTVTGYNRGQLPVDSDVVKFYEETNWECFAPQYEAPSRSMDTMLLSTEPPPMRSMVTKPQPFKPPAMKTMNNVIDLSSDTEDEELQASKYF